MINFEPFLNIIFLISSKFPLLVTHLYIVFIRIVNCSQAQQLNSLLDAQEMNQNVGVNMNGPPMGGNNGGGGGNNANGRNNKNFDGPNNRNFPNNMGNQVCFFHWCVSHELQTAIQFLIKKPFVAASCRL